MNISVIVPAKNEEAYISRLLSSVRQQTVSVEIIVADASSTDATARIASMFGAKIVSGGLPGPGRNIGAANANGQWLIFFDADVALPSVNLIEGAINEIESRGLDLATCRLAAFDGGRLDQIMHDAYNAYARVTERVLPHGSGSCLFVRRRVHEKIGGFDESVVFAEDHDYVRRARKYGFVFGVLRTQTVFLSTRRLKKEGRMRMIGKYIIAELLMLIRGSLKQLPFRYDFGGFTRLRKP